MNDSTGKQKALSLFHETYKTVPAYSKFVNSKGITNKDIKSISDFEKIPMMDKHNYINKYPIEQRISVKKSLADYYMICSSSGSSGQPTFWPRDYETDLLLEKKKEELYQEHFKISKKKTLCVISFGLGVWTAGMLTSKLSWAAAKNNKFSVITPGIDKENTLGMIKMLYKYYDQIILVGYPPFIGDVIEYAAKTKFNIKKANLKILCTSEWFSENWRNYIVKKISKDNSRQDLVGFYACSDTGIIGAETKSSIDLLNKSQKTKRLSEELFGSATNPSLAVYDPNIKFLESINGEIVITANQPVTLIRYNIHDRGGLLTGQVIKKIGNKFNVKTSLADTKNHYVYVFGRSDAVKITANIYVEDIKYCLEKSKYKNKFSGNFRYGREYINALRYRLKVIIYLKEKATLSIPEKQYFEKEFYENLLKSNNDFKMIQNGTKIEKFHFEYMFEGIDKYKTSKLKYFL